MFTKRREFLSGGLALTAGALSGTRVLAGETYNWTFTAGHPDVLPWIKAMDQIFLPGVTDGAAALVDPVTVNWNASYGGTIAKLGAESDAIRDGISDAGSVSFVFEAGKFPLHPFSFQVPFGMPDIRDQIALSNKVLAEIPSMKTILNTNNIVQLSLICVDNYALFTTEPFESFQDLKGRKILTPGPAANWIRNTGAVAVAGNLTTYYNDLKTGVADGAIVSLVSAHNAKLQEVTPYITNCDLGAMSPGGIGFSKRLYDSLSPDMQKIVLETGKEYETQFANAQKQLVVEARKTLGETGGIFYDLPQEERVKWASALPNIPKQWANALDAKGYQGSQTIRLYLEGVNEVLGNKAVRQWEV